MHNAMRRVSRTLAALMLLLQAVSPVLAEPFDLSPQQPGRLHVDRDAKAVAALPANYKFVYPGTLTVAVAVGSPPIAAYATDASTVVGFDPDLALLVAESLGLKLDLVSVAWADWPLGLVSGKYDAVISNVGVTEQRKQKFDFSTYRYGLHGFYVKNDSPITALKEQKDVAGLRIIVASGTIQERILLEWDKQNRANGLKPLELQYYDDEAAADLALQSGRADANFGPNAMQAWQAATLHRKRLVGTVNAGWPLTADVGVTTRKGSGLAEPIAVAINDLIAGGTYQAALSRWGLSQEGLTQSQVNPPGLPSY
ncbi:ABC transporter substrate-binding protein [Agrobacterium vitis]|nr:ABC transporter substrate-binding protein [Allorhizobium ampelinum]